MRFAFVPVAIAALLALSNSGRGATLASDAQEAGASEGVTLIGRVIAEGRPAAGVPVFVRPHSERPASDAPEAKWFRFVIDRSRNHLGLMETDEDGRFRFESLPPGRVDVEARRDDLVKVERIEVELESDPVEITLELPAAGSFAGGLIAPEDASFDQLLIRVAPPGLSSTQRRFAELLADPVDAEIPVDDAGRFRFGDLPTGEYEVFLVLPGRLIPTGRNTFVESRATHRRIGSVTVEADRQTIEQFDVRAVFPGRALLDVEVGDSADEGLKFEARWAGSEDRPEDSTGGSLRPGVAAATGPMFPGPWSFSFGPIEGQWLHELPEPITIHAGELVPIAVSIELVAGELLAIDPRSDNPAASRDLWLAYPSGTLRRLRTDEDGRMLLLLAPGSYRVLSVPPQTPDSFPTDAAELIWTPDAWQGTRLVLTDVEN